MSIELTKFLIQAAPNVEEADKVIKEIYDLETVQEKIAFLRGMFGIEIFSQQKDEQTYYGMLCAIINDKFFT